MKTKKPQIHLVLREDILKRLLQTHSSFNKLPASVAWLLRFREYLQSRVSKKAPRVGNLTVGEISRATREIVQVIQAQSFPKELEILSKERSAFSRFVSRRGSPVEVFSDNGTNFRGAEVEIKTALEKWNIDRIDNCLRRRGVTWHFNPPLASHAG